MTNFKFQNFLSKINILDFNLRLKIIIILEKEINSYFQYFISITLQRHYFLSSFFINSTSMDNFFSRIKFLDGRNEKME